MNQEESHPRSSLSPTLSPKISELPASIIERVSDGFVALDKDWRYTYVNQKAALLLNREKPEDLIGKHIWTEYPEGVGQSFYHAYYRAMETQEVVCLEDYYAPWDRWFENRIYPSSDRLTIYFTEITDRRRSERALHETEERLRLAVQAANVGLWDWNLETQAIFFSPEWKSQIGYEDHEIANDFDEWQSRVHPDDLEAALTTIHEYISNPYRNYQNEFRFRHKDGTYRWILAQADLVYNERGDPARMLGSHIDITTRKQAEAALRESEQRLSHIFHNSPVATVLTRTSDSRFVDVNEAVETLTGYSREELLGKTSLELDLFARPQARTSLVETSQTTGGYRDVHVQVRRKSGEIRDVSLSSGLIELGGEKYSIAMAHDITERKQVEEELRASEELFSSAFHVGPVGMTITRIADGTFIDANEAFCRMFEFPCDEVIGRTSTDLNLWTLEERRKLIQQQLESGGLQDFELVARSKSGRLLNVSFSSKEVQINGEACHLTTLVNITKRKRVEEALRASEARYRSLVEHASDGILVADERGYYVDVNTSGCTMLGYARKELIGKHIRDLVASENLAAQPLKDDLIKAGNPVTSERLLRRKDGTFISVEISGTRLPDGHLLGIVRDITERKRAEETLRVREERFRLAMQNIPDVVVIYEPDLRIQFINDATTQITGRPMSDFVGRRDDEIWPPAVYKSYMPALEKALQTRSMQLVETNLTLDDGTARDLTITCVPVLNEEGKVREIIGITHDFTERKQAEDALQRYNQRLTILREIDRNIIAARSSETMMSVVLRGIRQLIPCERATAALFDEDTAEAFVLAVATEGETAIRENVRVSLQGDPRIETLKTGQPALVQDMTERDESTSDVWKQLVAEGFRSSLVCPLFMQGQFIGALNLVSKTPDFFTPEHQEIAQEVANQLAIALHQAHLHEQLEQTNVQLEERVAERTAELQRNQARYRAIVEDQTDLVCRYLPSGVLTFVNQTYCQHYNKTSEELRGTSFFTLLPEEERSRLQQQIASLSYQNPATTIEIREPALDGQERWLQWSERMLFDEGGNFVEYQGVGRDITDRRMAEDQLRQMLEEAMKLSELRSRYVSMAAHDLRNPLAAIQTAITLVQEYGDKLGEERKQEKFDRVQSLIATMVDMLNDILTIGQTDSGKLHYSPVHLNLTAFCESLVEEMKPLIGATRQIEFSSQEDCHRVYVDPKLLRHILSNLLSNALKYSDVDTAVTFTVRCDSNQIVFRIGDHGIGIPQADQVRLVEAFHRASNARKVTGTGLGLAIVKQSVDLHGGTITFESQENEGTTFIVSLPQTPNE